MVEATVSRAPSDDAEWQELINRLHDNLDQLVENFLTELGPLDEYGNGHVDADDVRATAYLTLDMLVLQLAGSPLQQRHRDAARDLGARRARQGVHRDALMDAVRLDFRVLWVTLTQFAGEGAEAVLVLVQRTQLSENASPHRSWR